MDDPTVHATILNKKTKKETNGVVNISLINNLLSHHEIIENLKKINELI